jgi:hypothetical protein
MENSNTHSVYRQHCDISILIPQHISRRAFISAPLLLYNSVLAYSLNYKIICILLGSVYITTILHWNAVKYSSKIKTIDTVLANITILHLTFVDSYRFCPDHQQYWMYVFYIILGGFAMNEYLLYMQVTRFSNTVVYVENTYTKWPLSLLNYTNPNTYERELAYYRSTYTHMFFVHIVPSVISFLFGILSHYQCNWKCI